jgi:hypothetical protein
MVQKKVQPMLPDPCPRYMAHGPVWLVRLTRPTSERAGLHGRATRLPGSREQDTCGVERSIYHGVMLRITKAGVGKTGPSGGPEGETSYLGNPKCYTGDLGGNRLGAPPQDQGK